MYLVVVRAAALRALAPDTAAAFRRAVLGSASSPDGLAHVYAVQAPDGVSAVLFMLAPTLEQAEARARSLCFAAALRAGLVLERCEVDLSLPLEEARLHFRPG